MTSPISSPGGFAIGELGMALQGGSSSAKFKGKIEQNPYRDILSPKVTPGGVPSSIAVANQVKYFIIIFIGC
jgi:hypothetical protein